MSDLAISGEIGPELEHHFVEVPFDVPAGVRAVAVRYSYSEPISARPEFSGGNTIDLGLFGPGDDYRGWSGSERSRIVIAQRWATPPYRAGVTPGAWRVLLGAYKLSPRGCRWQVGVTFDPPADRPEAAPAVAPARSALEPPAEAGWLRGDLHCHSLWSDGDSHPSIVLAAAAEAGLDFLGVTDHNVVTHHEAYGAGGEELPLVIGGIEVTTYRGHWNAWGAPRWYEFRDLTDEGVERAIGEAKRDGALVSIDHPKPLGPEWHYGSVSGYDAVEAWNGPWPLHNEDSLRFWDERLRRGERVVAVGGSDTHRLRGPREGRALGRPTTWVRAGRTVAEILEALRQGASFVSASPSGPQLYLEPDRIRVVGAEGALCRIVDGDGVAQEVALDRHDVERALRPRRGARYVRAEVRRGDLMLALSNAVRP